MGINIEENLIRTKKTILFKAVRGNSTAETHK